MIDERPSSPAMGCKNPQDYSLGRSWLAVCRLRDHPKWATSLGRGRPSISGDDVSSVTTHRVAYTPIIQVTDDRGAIAACCHLLELVQHGEWLQWLQHPSLHDAVDHDIHGNLSADSATFDGGIHISPLCSGCCQHRYSLRSASESR